MKTILVTGGAGFIGSNYLNLVVPQNPSITYINFDCLTYAGNLENLTSIENAPNYKFVKGNICSVDEIKSVFSTYQITDVVHFAAESHVDRSILGPRAFIETNINGTFNLLEVAKEFWQKESSFSEHRFHHISTDEVYGTLGETGLFTEETPYTPNSPYSASKAASDHLVRAYHETFGMNVITTNCSNNYGPYQFPEKLIPLMFQNAATGKALPVYGDGKNVRDWLHVKDHAEAIDLVFKKGKSGETYNIGGHNEKQNIEIVHLICKFVDTHVKPKTSAFDLITFVEDRLGHDKRYAIDASKIQRDLGWVPKYTFETGIEETLHWYLTHSEWISRVLSGDYQEYYTMNYGKRA